MVSIDFNGSFNPALYNEMRPLSMPYSRAKTSHVWSLRGRFLSLARRTQTATRSISFDQLFCNTASDEEVESNCRFIPGK